jgi:pyruvate dehydrogenase E1 component beta subunit
MTRTTYREALREAHRQALAADSRVFIMGEHVGRQGGIHAVTRGLLEEFGPQRVRDTPPSELGFVGAGIGAALGGMRPVIEAITGHASLLALDDIVHTAAGMRHLSGGQYSVPVVIRLATGPGRPPAARPSSGLEVWYAHVPGLKVLAPATVADARGMLQPALDDPDPVVMFEHARLHDLEDDLPDPPPRVDITCAAVRRPGTDLTVVTYGGSLPRVLAAASTLAGQGVQAEVVDLRVLRPLDMETVLASVRRTHRLLVVDEGWRTCSLAAEVIAAVTEGAFFALHAPPARVCSEEVPVPGPGHLEEAVLPGPPRIVAAARALCAHRS